MSRNKRMVCVCVWLTLKLSVDKSSRSCDLKKHVCVCMWYVIILQDHRYSEPPIREDRRDGEGVVFQESSRLSYTRRCISFTDLSNQTVVTIVSFGVSPECFSLVYYEKIKWELQKRLTWGCRPHIHRVVWSRSYRCAIEVFLFFVSFVVFFYFLFLFVFVFCFFWDKTGKTPKCLHWL